MPRANTEVMAPRVVRNQYRPNGRAGVSSGNLLVALVCMGQVVGCILVAGLDGLDWVDERRWTGLGGLAGVE